MRLVLSVSEGSRGKEQESSSKMRLRFMGIYFESCLLGVRDATPPPGYDIWLTSSRTKQTRARIKQYADSLRDRFDLDGDGLSDVALEFDFTPVIPLKLRGVADYIGIYRGDMNKPEFLCLDIKLTSDIEETWGISFGISTKFLQSSIYSILAAITHGDKEKYLDIMDKFMSDKATAKEMYDWVSSTTTAVPAFLIVESQHGSQEFSDDVLVPSHDPITQLYRIKMEPRDFWNTPYALSKYSVYYEDMIAAHNEGADIMDMVDPNVKKCLGKGSKDGRCTFLYSCKYAKEKLFGDKTIKLSSIL
ncbi:hypothetical protein [uncultured Sphaerochaeta sp.]|uniref:hypothetical protein n=1 Tax=uncultured Sphaerochaeta sp. TaxID=886478 RepID=UPI0026360E44|nr:hypothetical protein [uncultured Sphaerochaeta sp.]